MTDKPEIQGIGQIAIAVSDIRRSVAFYRDVLGLSLLFEAPPGLAFFNCGGVRLMLTIPQGEVRDHHTSVIYYKVADIHAAMEILAGRGVKLSIHPSHNIPGDTTARERLNEALVEYKRRVAGV